MYTAIGSCDYDGWVNRAGKKNGYTKMQGGFKIIPCLLEGLVREDKRKKNSPEAIRSRGAWGERGRLTGQESCCRRERLCEDKVVN